MQALDTNLLVRLFVGDDAAQAAKVCKLLDSHASEDAAFWVSDTVLVALAWTLERSYARPRADVVRCIDALLNNTTLGLESPAAVAEALALYTIGPADFADCLLASKAARAGCDSLRSFDKKMRGLPGVVLL